ncbi:FAD-binding oxidoreductase [Candidatus Saccharibacteria bacterium]|nr:FAD-binding oxidoreductase [Candidatus Saccharibacteria bacterium]
MSSRLADYLNKYLDGVAVSAPEVLRRYANDGSVLDISPEVVVQPVGTTDVRKTVLLSSQLAEKGLRVSVTPRGSGSDKTGAAIGDGIVLDMRRYMNRIISVDPRQRLVHVQAGATISEVNKALQPHGLCLPLTLMGFENPELNDQNHTIGGLIANNLGGQALPRLGRLVDYLVQLEVVLADGSVYHTTSLSGRKLKTIGVETTKGKEEAPSFADRINAGMYKFVRENSEVLAELRARRVGNTGYLYGMTQVGDAEKSLNLMPLFLGSQGSLGVITEVILSVDYLGPSPDLMVAKFDNVKQALAFAGDALSENPSILNLADGRLFAEAGKSGKSFLPLGGLPDSTLVMLVGFDDSSAKHRQKKIRNLSKILTKNDISYVSSLRQEFNEEYFNSILKAALNRVERNTVQAPILDGVIVPFQSVEKYLNGLPRLERLLDNKLMAYGSLITDLWTVRPEVDFTGADKRPILRLAREYGRFVLECDGILAGEGGEGRVKAVSSLVRRNDFADSVDRFVKKQFDPRGIMNAGVKQTITVDQVMEQIRRDNDFGIMEL